MVTFPDGTPLLTDGDLMALPADLEAPVGLEPVVWVRLLAPGGEFNVMAYDPNTQEFAGYFEAESASWERDGEQVSWGMPIWSLDTLLSMGFLRDPYFMPCRFSELGR